MPIAAKTGARIRYLFLLLLFACIGLWLLQQFRRDSKEDEGSPVAWKPYSEAIRNSTLAEGRKVLVFVFAELNPESTIALAGIDSATVRTLCDGEDCEPLLLQYGDWSDPRIRSIWKDVGHTKNPMLVLYSSKEDPLACDPFSGVPLCR